MVRVSRNGASPAEWSSEVTLVGHKAWLLHAEFSPDSTLVLTSSYDRTHASGTHRPGSASFQHVGHDGRSQRGPIQLTRIHPGDRRER